MIGRRSEKTMLDLIIEVAQCDDRIRGVIMNGSRANPNAKRDKFQDYDIVYLVDDVIPFVKDERWINQFGEFLIMQTPDEMDGNWEISQNKFTYLMLFTDWNRIDLTLRNRNEERPRDSLSVLLLDKDDDFKLIDPPSDKDYLPQPPTEKQFQDCCNEFFWVSTYVAKGIWRKELLYAKYMSEGVRESLIMLLTWYAGMKTNFEINLGNCGKYLEKYIEPGLWLAYTKTYVDHDYNHMWDGLLGMCSIFDEVASEVSKHYGYFFDRSQYQRVIEYLQEVRRDTVS